MRNKAHLILFSALALVAISPLFVDAWFFAHDSAVHLVRLNDVSYQMANGNYYPRWLSLSCLGKGSPALNFYAPGFYLVTCYLHLLGIPLLWALRIVCFALFAAGGWGMYLWTERHLGKPGAFLAGFLYMFAPYHFLDLYVRGALPEFAALAFLPFLFYGIDAALSRDDNFSGIIGTAAASAAIVLTHNLSAFMVAPFAAAYFVWRAVALGAPRRRVLSACLGPLLGAGVSAFYWLPVLLESKYLGNLGSLVSEKFRYQENFLEPYRWFDFNWGYQGFEPPPNGMSFQLGYLTLAALVLAALALVYAKKERRFAVGTALLGVGALVMTTALSEPVYRAVPLLAFVQFPWRFLGPATVFLSALGGAAALLPVLKSERNRALFVGLLVAGGVVLSATHRKVDSQLPVPLEDQAFRTYGQPLFTYATEDEFLPKDARLSVKAILPRPVQVIGSSVVPVENFERRGSRMTCLVSATQDSDLVLPWFYFPGWQGRCDGAPVPVVSSSQGLVALAVPPGNHQVEVWFGTTGPRIGGWSIALVTLGGVVGASLLRWRKKRS